MTVVQPCRQMWYKAWLRIKACLRWLKGRPAYLYHLLINDRTPVWVTVVASCIAAWATYVIAPAINREMQQDNTRATHVLSTISDVNRDMIDLSQKIRRFNNALLNSDKKEIAIRREECLDQITAMQWKLVNVDVIVTHPDHRNNLIAMRGGLDTLRLSVRSSSTADDRSSLQKATMELSVAAYTVLSDLYSVSGFATSLMPIAPEGQR